MLVDYTFTHPGAHLQDVNRASLADPDAVGNHAVLMKVEKYMDATRSSRDPHYVLLPFHISVFGRIHPLALSFLRYICDRIAARALQTPPSSILSTLNPDARNTACKRTLMRNMSTAVQRSLTLGMLHAAQRIVRPADVSRTSAIMSLQSDNLGSPLPINSPLV